MRGRTPRWPADIPDVAWGKSKWQARIMLGRRTVVRAEYGPPFPTLGNIYGPRRWYDKPWGAIDPASGLAHVSWTERWETKGLVATRRSVIAAFTMPVRAHAFRQVVAVARFPTDR